MVFVFKMVDLFQYSGLVFPVFLDLSLSACGWKEKLWTVHFKNTEEGEAIEILLQISKEHTQDMFLKLLSSNLKPNKIWYCDL